MIAIIPADESQTRLFLAEAGLTVDKLSSVACLLYREGEDCTGFILYTVQEACVELLALSGRDWLAQDALVRAALSAAQGQGAAEAVCHDEKLAALLVDCGFSRDGKGAWTLIRDFFAHSGCHARGSSC